MIRATRPTGPWRWTRDAAIAFAVLGLALLAAHAEELVRIRRVAAREVDGEGSTPEQRLSRAVRFVQREVRVNRRPQDVSPWPVRLYYQLSPLHPGPGDVLRWGTDYRGPCGSKSRLVKAILKAGGDAVRLRLLLDDEGTSVHTVVEVRDGDRWILADPTYGIVYHLRDGRGATAEDLGADTALFRAHVDTIPGYGAGYDYDAHTLLNWEKVPILLPAIRDLLTRVMGAERVAEIKRPTLWMYPRLFYALAFLGLALLCLLVRRRLPRRA